MANAAASIKLHAIDKISSVLKNVGGSFNAFRENVKSANDRLSTFNQLNEKTAKNMRRIGGAMQSAGRRMSLAVTAPVVAAAAGSVKAFADFENGMMSVKTLLDSASFASGNVQQGFGAMQKEMLALFKSTNQPMDSMVKGLFDTVSAGVDASKAVGVLGSASKLAVAGLTDVATATDGMTSAMNAWGLSADKADIISAKFFTAQKRGKTTVAELSGNLGKVSAIAATAGVSFDEVLASVSAVTLAGVGTSEAFTGLKAVFSNITKPTEQAKEASKLLGIEFNSTALKSKGFTKFFEDIITNAKRIGVDPRIAIETLFGSIEALGVAQALAGKQGESYSKILAELSDETRATATFTDAYAQQTKTLTFQLGQLKNSAIGAGISIGESLRPTIVQITGLMERLARFAEQNPAFVNLAAKIAVAAAALGPFLMIFGSLIKMWPLIKGIGIAIGLAMGTISAPVLAAVAAVTALVTGLVALYKNWDKVKGFLKGVSNKVFNPFQLGGTAPEVANAAERRAERVVPEFGAARNAPAAPGGPSLSGQANINIDFKNAPDGTKIKVDKAGFSDFFDISTGLQGAGAL